MLVFSNCKINIGLRVTEKRPDGYHNIESVFFPVPWFDALEIIESHVLSLSISGVTVPGEVADNLCFKAWHLLKKDFPLLPQVQIYLHKTIPIGAGLGGGSANGAFMLKSLNHKFSLGLAPDQLASYALQLGSDCPFFIYNTPSVARMRGDNLNPINLNLNGYFLVLVNPGIHIPTSWAFKQLKPALPINPLENLVQLPVENWAEAGVINDFEAAVCKENPEISALKNQLLQAGAVFASMTGSGSSCYGLFKNQPNISADNFPTHYLVKQFSI